MEEAEDIQKDWNKREGHRRNKTGGIVPSLVNVWVPIAPCSTSSCVSHWPKREMASPKPP